MKTIIYTTIIFTVLSLFAYLLIRMYVKIKFYPITKAILKAEKLCNNGYFRESIKTANQALVDSKMSEHSALLHEIIGDSNRKLGNNEKSKYHYLQAVQNCEEMTYSYAKLGEIYLEEGNYRKSIEMLFRANELQTNLFYYKILLALAHKLSGNTDQFEKFISEIKQSNESNTIIEEVLTINQDNISIFINKFA